MSDRLAQARAEAERRIGGGMGVTVNSAARQGFVLGVEWADANPQPHTITRAEYEDAKVRHDDWAASTDPDLAFLAGLHRLGIEVEDDR